MANHSPGKYPAKIVDFGIWTGKDGTKAPSAVVMFEYKTPGGEVKQITWFGSFNGGAREITVETLIRMGFTGKNGAELNQGNGSGVLNQAEDAFEIVLENDTYQGKTTCKVRYINLPGGGGFRAKMAEGEANVLMGGLNLSGDFAAARAQAGAPKPAPKPAAPIMQENFASQEDIPF
jgi:hypothetical protein